MFNGAALTGAPPFLLFNREPCGRKPFDTLSPGILISPGLFSRALGGEGALDELTNSNTAVGLVVCTLSLT